MHLRQYLDAWMGSTGTVSTPRHQNQDSPAASRDAQQPFSPPHAPPIAMTVAGKSYLVPTLRLPRGLSPSELKAGLRATTSLSAGYFQSAPMVVDLGEWLISQPLPRGGVRTASAGVGGEVLDGSLLATFVAAMKEAGLHPVGIANATATDVRAAALELGLPCFMARHAPPSPSTPAPALASIKASAPVPPQRRTEKEGTRASASRPAPTTPPSPPPSPPPSSSTMPPPSTSTVRASPTASPPLSPPPSSLPAMVVQGSVRTGQQVVAEGTSLVVLGHVHSGAEVSADGDIHIYGKLTGRALAGLSGDVRAKIFAGRFNAELVAIGEVFTTCDVGEGGGEGEEGGVRGVVGGPASVSLEEKTGKLVFGTFKV